MYSIYLFICNTVQTILVFRLKNRILQLLNKRYLEKLKERWWKRQKTCMKLDDQSDGISIQNIGGVFIVIFVGIVLACITLVFEYWWYKYRKVTPRITNVIESVENSEKMMRKDQGAFQNRDSNDVKNSLLRPRLTNKKVEQKY